MELDVFLFNYVLKIVLAGLCGAVIGLEREISGKPAGLRTTVLICVGSCLFVILSYVMAWDDDGSQIGDPARIAAQIVTGIGFLGAGAIIQSRGSVIGLTTAATIWVTASIGMAIGIGYYPLAVVTTLIILFVLLGLRRVDAWLLKHVRQSYDVDIKIVPEPAELRGVLNRLRDVDPFIDQLHVERENHQYRIRFTFQVDREDRQDFRERFASLKGVKSLHLEKTGLFRPK